MSPFTLPSVVCTVRRKRLLSPLSHVNSLNARIVSQSVRVQFKGAAAVIVWSVGDQRKGLSREINIIPLTLTTYLELLVPSGMRNIYQTMKT